MTGPEHYRQAETYLDDTAELLGPDADMEYLAHKVAVAQAHATLALAAATALAARSSDDGGLAGMPDADYQKWDVVAGVWHA